MDKFKKNRKNGSEFGEKVKTTSAQTSTTNTTVQSETLIDEPRNKIIYQTTTQRTDHHQIAHVTETVRSYEIKENDLNDSEFYKEWEMKGKPNMFTLQNETATQRNETKCSSHVETKNVKINNNLFNNINKIPPSTKFQIDAKMISPPTRNLRKTLPSISTAPSLSSSTTPSSSFLSSSSGTVPKTYLKPNATSTYQSPYRTTNPILASSNEKPVAATSMKQPVKNPNNLKPAKAYIFNNEDFKKFRPNVSKRDGSKHDVDALKKTFKNFKVGVTLKQDPTLDDINSVMKKLQKENFCSISAVIIVVLSHGDRNDIVSAADKDYSLDDTILFPLLDNPSLQNKPKIILSSACKGDRNTNTLQKDAKPFGRPTEILKFYSTFEGYPSYRKENEGTVFIQKFCEVMDTHAKTKNIKEIIELVQKDIKKTNRDQVPSYTTTLTQPYVFGDYC